MVDDVGIIRTSIAVASVSDPNYHRELPDVVVDARSEYNWIPSDVLLELGVAPVRTERFETADGRVLERDVGFAFVFARGRSAPSIAVFAGEGDSVVLGAIGLDGLNLRVDAGKRELVPAGPIPAARLAAGAL